MAESEADTLADIAADCSTDTESARVLKNICLGCGGSTVVRKRSVLGGHACSELLPIFNAIISKRLSESGVAYSPQDLDTVLKASYLCKSCTTSYKKVVSVYNATARSVVYITKKLESVTADDSFIFSGHETTVPCTNALQIQ